MNRHLGRLSFFSRTCIVASFILITQSACSSRQSPPVVVNSADGSTGTTSDSTESSSTSDSDIYGTGTTTPSNLFDTTTNSDAAPAGTSSTSTTTSTTSGLSSYTDTSVSGSQAQCLSGSASVGSSYTTAGSSLPAACYNSQSSMLTNSSLYGMGARSFGAMGYCYQLVVQRAGQYCASGSQLDQQSLSLLYQQSQMGLVRCFRSILQQHMMATQWMPQQKQSYQSNDQMLFLLLSMFSKEE